jgi:hypothetical protein
VRLYKKIFTGGFTMKKITVALLTLVLLCTLVVPAFAAVTKNAFENVVMNGNEDEFGYHTNDSGRLRNGKNISYMEAYGCGNGAMGDSVEFKNVDFGKNGAKEMVLSFSYGGENTTTVAVKLDDAKSAPIATYAITNTGGWDKTKAKEFTTAVKVPGGVHNVFVEFTNEESGSFSYIRFVEADAPVAGATTTTTAPTAPATADMGVIASVAAIATAAAGFVALKKR